MQDNETKDRAGSDARVVKLEAERKLREETMESQRDYGDENRGA